MAIKAYYYIDDSKTFVGCDEHTIKPDLCPERYNICNGGRLILIILQLINKMWLGLDQGP